jgi:hypothetical protein
MAADDTTVVVCPCCADQLYRFQHLADGTWTKPSSCPPFEHDKRGHFIICAHCSKRIDFLALGSDDKGRHVFQMAPKQPCTGP